MNKHDLDDYRAHLIAAGKTKQTVWNYILMVRRFLKHVGDDRLDRLSEERSRAFFADLKGQNRMQYSMVVSQYLRFAAARLPVPVNVRGAESPRAAVPAKLR